MKRENLPVIVIGNYHPMKKISAVRVGGWEKYL
jgi:hypothetical protein